MEYPKSEAFKVETKDHSFAVKWATNKRKFGGSFEQKGDVFVVYWLPKNHPQISNFAW